MARLLVSPGEIPAAERSQPSLPSPRSLFLQLPAIAIAAAAVIDSWCQRRPPRAGAGQTSVPPALAGVRSKSQPDNRHSH